MGYNTVVMFSNDQLQEAAKHPGEVMDHVRRAGMGLDSNERPWGIQVIPAYHADLAPIFIGGANSLKHIGDLMWTQKDDIPAILRAIAEKHGYKIAIRKRPPK